MVSMRPGSGGLMSKSPGLYSSSVALHYNKRNTKIKSKLVIGFFSALGLLLFFAPRLSLFIACRNASGSSCLRYSRKGTVQRAAVETAANATVVRRDMFPPDFVFGTATGAYQVEGAYNEGGRGLSIWDKFSRTPGKTFNGDTGDVAIDQYHRFWDDIILMKELGVDAYRFSVSWPRIFPNGRGNPNPEGIAYYNRLIDALIRNGITPYLTIFHWDVPLVLQEEFGGFLIRCSYNLLKHASRNLVTGSNIGLLLMNLLRYAILDILLGSTHLDDAQTERNALRAGQQWNLTLWVITCCGHMPMRSVSSERNINPSMVLLLNWLWIWNGPNLERFPTWMWLQLKGRWNSQLDG